jgi:hypothetical protein
MNDKNKFDPNQEKIMITATEFRYLTERIEKLEQEVAIIKKTGTVLPIEEFSEGKLRKILHTGQEQIRILVATGKLEAVKINRGGKIRLRFTAQAVQDYQKRMSAPWEPKYIETAEEIAKRICV